MKLTTPKPHYELKMPVMLTAPAPPLEAQLPKGVKLTIPEVQTVWKFKSKCKWCGKVVKFSRSSGGGRMRVFCEGRKCRNADYRHKQKLKRRAQRKKAREDMKVSRWMQSQMAVGG